jgi:hypothetical protein
MFLSHHRILKKGLRDKKGNLTKRVHNGLARPAPHHQQAIPHWTFHKAYRTLARHECSPIVL